MKKFSFTILLLLFFTTSPKCATSQLQRAIDPELQQGIDDFVNNHFLPLANIGSLGLAVVQNDGQLLYTTGYGLADVERQVPVENITQHFIGSITKSMTSIVIAKLLAEKFPLMGETALDTPIRKLIPQANFTLNDRFRSEYMTFRDLLSHRTCLIPAEFPTLSGVFDRREDYTYGTRYVAELCGLRTNYVYNSRAYMVAGELAGILAGKTYEELVMELLAALGMSDSTFSKETDDYTQMPYRAMPYYVMDMSPHPMNTSLVGRISTGNAAGGVVSTPNDMVKYLRFHLNKGSLDGRQIVPQRVMAWLTKPSMVVDGSTFKGEPEDLVLTRFAAGLGLLIGSYDGWKHVSHGGFWVPYVSLMSLFPEKNLAIFSTTGQSPPLADFNYLHAAIFNLIEGGAMMTGGKSMETRLVKLKSQLDAEREWEAERAQNEFQSRISNLPEVPVGKQETIVGKYGSGSLGELEVSERFNPERNQTEYYLEYGVWYRGWLKWNLGTLYQLDLTTDAIQDANALGLKESITFVIWELDLLHLFQVGGLDNTFERNLSPGDLPPVPWAPDSCGPPEESA